MKIGPHVSGVLMIKKDLKVEEAGIEPATCRMRSDHSTPELHPRLDMLQSLAIFYYNILFLATLQQNLLVVIYFYARMRKFTPYIKTYFLRAHSLSCLFYISTLNIHIGNNNIYIYIYIYYSLEPVLVCCNF